MAWMYAINDDGSVDYSKGDSGGMSRAYWIEDNEVRYEAAKPRVGVRMRVGSTTARSFSAQDYWQTTPVTEIIKEEVLGGRISVTFKTANSTYLWKE